MSRVQLHSKLSYAERNALLDSQRKVLACPHAGCLERETWTDAKDATLKGWGFEDRVVDGEVLRQWFCPMHRPMDPLAPLPQRHLFPSFTGVGCEVAFGGLRAVLLRLGASNGTQLAIVLDEGETYVSVVGWHRTSARWTNLKLVPKDKILGPPPPKDKRLRCAAGAWPPEHLKRRKTKRCKRPRAPKSQPPNHLLLE